MLLTNDWKKSIIYQKVISHRANLFGPNPNRENKISAIEEVISKNIDVEVDIYVQNGDLFLGHDYPETPINISFLNRYASHLWIHCKNKPALAYLMHFNRQHHNILNFFFHQQDECTITTHNYIWTFANTEL
ncbi:MAG: hypothetical protein QW279_12185, partial [Candidatus Jordarchaeaceae archaeon]